MLHSVAFTLIILRGVHVLLLWCWTIIGALLFNLGSVKQILTPLSSSRKKSMVDLSTVTELEDSIHLFNGIYIYIK
jgi:hypothetical protein